MTATAGPGGDPPDAPADTAAAQWVTDVAAAVAAAHRREWAFVLAATVRVARDLDTAQECVQDAYVAALGAWSRQGVPRNPGAWLTTTARRRAMDVLRRDATLRAKLPLLVEPEPEAVPGEAGGGDREAIPDDRLRLIFTCCHPALARDAQVALTLRLACGLTTAQIAQAFLVPEPTMAARVTRAKKKISAARICYRVPGAAELPERLDAVLTVVYLLYTTGHTAPSVVQLSRADLVGRAAELARLLAALMPDEAEARGLLALILLTDARRASRIGPGGRLMLLAEQDRAQWDHDAIADGAALIAGPRRRERPGKFVLQAAIAAVHSQAPAYADTDWAQLVALYGELMAAWPSPVVALNRAAAVAMARGPAAGLAELAVLERDGRLTGYRYLPAAKADMLRRLGRAPEAAQAYRAALALTENLAEKSFLHGRIAELAPAAGTAQAAAPDPPA